MNAQAMIRIATNTITMVSSVASQPSCRIALVGMVMTDIQPLSIWE